MLGVWGSRCKVPDSRVGIEAGGFTLASGLAYRFEVLIRWGLSFWSDPWDSVADLDASSSKWRT